MMPHPGCTKANKTKQVMIHTEDFVTATHVSASLVLMSVTGCDRKAHKVVNMSQGDAVIYR